MDGGELEVDVGYEGSTVGEFLFREGGIEVPLTVGNRAEMGDDRFHATDGIRAVVEGGEFWSESQLYSIQFQTLNDGPAKVPQTRSQQGSPVTIDKSAEETSKVIHVDNGTNSG